MTQDQYVLQYMTEIISSGQAKGKTLIIDPALYGALNHTIPRHEGDIVFVGFDKISPLEIVARSDTELEVLGDIWIVECIIGDIQYDMSGLRGMRLMRSDILPKYQMGYTPFPIYMDEESFDFYRDQRKGQNKNLRNNTVILRKDDDMEKDFEETLSRAVKIDILSYLATTEPLVTLKETEEGIQIEGININLSGPQLYDFANVSKIKGDVVIYNDLAQKLGNVEVEGQIAVVNRY